MNTPETIDSETDPEASAVGLQRLVGQHPCGICGAEMFKNPHPKAGIPAYVIEHGAVWECYQCANKRAKRARVSSDFYRKRVELIQGVQSQMRDPERQVICDILANAQFLPDPDGKRYGSIQPNVKNNRAR